jgi:predicted membrane-bound spermidine synthase
MTFSSQDNHPVDNLEVKVVLVDAGQFCQQNEFRFRFVQVDRRRPSGFETRVRNYPHWRNGFFKEGMDSFPQSQEFLE